MTMQLSVAFVTVKLAHSTLPSPTTAKWLTMSMSQAITLKPPTTSATGNAALSSTFPYFFTIFADTIHIWLSPRFLAVNIKLAQFRWSVKTWSVKCSSNVAKTYFATRWCFLQTRSKHVQSLRKTDETQFNHLESLISSKYPNADFKPLLRKGVFPMSTSICSRNLTSSLCQIARNSYERCEKKSAQLKTLTTRSACGQLLDATLIKTILSYTWRATCAN